MLYTIPFAGPKYAFQSKFRGLLKGGSIAIAEYVYAYYFFYYTISMSVLTYDSISIYSKT